MHVQGSWLRLLRLLLVVASAASCALGSAAQQRPDLPTQREDDDPPILSNVRVVTDLNGNALVTWTTNEQATSAIAYGQSTRFDSGFFDSDFVVNHAILLSGLVTEKRYFYRLTCVDRAGNVANSAVMTWVQGITGNDRTPPVLSDVAVVLDGVGGATVTWTTDEPATSLVAWGTDDSYGSRASSSSLVTRHALAIAGLSSGTLYHFQVQSTDAYDNVATSPDDTFLYSNTGIADVTGTLTAWHPITLSFHGPAATELDDVPNPFLDYRMTVVFTGPSGQELFVPGFFDGNGAGGGSGDVWRCRFVADEGGLWGWSVDFDAGTDIAVDTDLGSGTPVSIDGARGTVLVGPRDPAAPGFYRHGRLEYVGRHYLKFRDGPYFLKGGVDGPENLLGYKGFDNTFDQPGGSSTIGLENGLHRYLPHVADWGVAGLGDEDDPDFTSEQSGADAKGLIGLLNYLESVEVNSIYFLPMNLEGDGRETCPFIGYQNNAFDKSHYDVSKLAQWNTVFEHAQRHGILIQFVLAEMETGNQDYLDGGVLGPERKLFYRELSARFGHCLALKWNLSEEALYTVGLLRQFADYLDAVDPYDHPIAFHTQYLPSSGAYGPYSSVLGDTRFDMTSLQGAPEDMGSHVRLWRASSASAGRPWVVDVDEIGPPAVGLSDANADTLRRTALWDVYLNGGNVEWYLGGHALPVGGDQTLEDMRTRAPMWTYLRHARTFVENHLPFWEMSPAPALVTGETPAFGGAEVFFKANDTYAVYLPASDATGTLDLSGTTGTFQKRWYDPRNGVFVGGASAVSGGRPHALGAPPAGTSADDWVVLFAR